VSFIFAADKFVTNGLANEWPPLTILTT